MKCTSCGYDNQIGSRFCVKCGNCLTQEASGASHEEIEGQSIAEEPAVEAVKFPSSPPPQKPLSAGKIIGIALAVLIGIAGLVAIITSAIHSVTDNRNNLNIFDESVRLAANSEDDFEIPALSDEPTKIEKYSYEYRNDVAVIKQAPAYSVDETDDRLVITVHNPNDGVKRLAVGDTFAFEPSDQNPDGVAGHIVSIAHGDAKTVITANIPGALDEVFDEFEFAGDINLLADAVEIIPDDEMEGADGVEFARNPTRLFEARFTDANIGGITLNGKLAIFTPRVNVSLGLNSVNHLVVTMAAEVYITASSELNIDRVIPLFTIPVSFHGVRIDVPVGLRINASGQGSLELDCRVDAQFGIRNNKASGQANVRHTFNYHYSARVELTVNVQAKASVMLVPVYGIQGDFGMGARTDDGMQRRCPDGKCFVIGLFHIRRISSLNWGAFGWIRVLQFSENLVSDEVTDYRHLSDVKWYSGCPHDGSVPMDEEPADTTSPSSSLSHLGEPVTLEEARSSPGLYIKDGDMFIYVKPQWELARQDGYWATYSLRSEVATIARGIDTGSTSASVVLPILYDADFEIPKIPNNVQLVIIGNTDAAIYEVLGSGWTIPYGLALWDDSIGNPGGWPSFPVSELLAAGTGGAHDSANRKFEEINGEAPANYVGRMLYTGYAYNLASTCGILNAAQNEQFTFGWMDGTSWSDVTYTADKRYYLLPVDDSVAIQANYIVSETQDGYFEVVFLTPPEGLYGTGRSRNAGSGGFNNIVEFVVP